MNIIYLGLPEGALALIEAGHRLAAVCVNRRGPASVELRRRLDRTGTPLLFRPDLGGGSVRQLLSSAGAPLMVCYLWDRLLPAEVIASSPQGAISYHPSLLPRHRGPDPYFWTIWTGDERAGVSILKLDAGMDTGVVIDQRSIELSPDIDGGGLAQRLDAMGLELLVDVLERWERLGPLHGNPQDEGRATLAPKPSDDLLELRWSWPTERLERLIRAASPHPGAFTFVGDLPVVVTAAHRHDTDLSASLKPGEALLLPEGMVVRGADGCLMLDAVHLDGGSLLLGREAVREAFTRDR
jgi:methionyl-tRNA formyltransferase